jgi:hypothetical protein
MDGKNLSTTTTYRRSHCAGCGRRAWLDRGRICRACRHTDRAHGTRTTQPYLDALRRLYGERDETDPAATGSTETKRKQ